MLISLLLVRELRGRGRWRLTYIWRAGHVLLLGGLVSLFALAYAGEFACGGRFAGREILAPFALGQAIAVGLFAACTTLAGVLAERDGRTLELLLLSGLRPRQIVGAKWAAGTISGLLLLAAGTPFLFSLLGLGGVSLEQAAGLAVLTASLAGLGAALGLFAGGVARNERQACVLALGAAFGWLVALPALLQLGWECGGGEGTGRFFAFSFGSWWAEPPRLPLLGWISPAVALADLLLRQGAGAARSWPANAAVNLLASCFFLWLAGRFLARRALAREEDASPCPAAARPRRRRCLPEGDPVAWRLGRVTAGGFPRWPAGLFLLLLAVASALVASAGEEQPGRFRDWTVGRDFTQNLALFLLLGCALGALFRILLLGARAFLDERRLGVGPLLLLSGLEPWRIWRGKIKGVFGGAAVLLLGAGSAGALFAAWGQFFYSDTYAEPTLLPHYRELFYLRLHHGPGWGLKLTDDLPALLAALLLCSAGFILWLVFANRARTAGGAPAGWALGGTGIMVLVFLGLSALNLLEFSVWSVWLLGALVALGGAAFLALSTLFFSLILRRAGAAFFGALALGVLWHLLPALLLARLADVRFAYGAWEWWRLLGVSWIAADLAGAGAVYALGRSLLPCRLAQEAWREG